jgi:hypothetical protein
LFEAQIGGGLGDGVGPDDVRVFRADGHDTTLLMMRTALRSCTYWTLELRGKVSFERPRFSPKGGMSVWVILWGVWITGHLSWFR